MNSAKPNPVQKLWNRHYIFVAVINTLNAFSFYMVATILSKYLVGIGTSISLAGFIVGLFSLTSLVLRPMCGIMSDRLNKLFLLKASNLLMAIGLLGFSITDQIPLIIFFRILNGIGFAIGGTAQVALATEYIPENKMGEGIGYLGLGMVLGSAVAPAIGIMIAESFGIQFTFVLSAVFALVAFVLVFTFRETEVKTVVPPRRIHFQDIIAPEALPYTLVSGTLSFINGVVASYLVLYADSLKVGGISLYFTLYAVVLFVVRPVAGKLMDRKGIRMAVLPALALTAVSMFMLSHSVTLVAILLSGIIRSLGQGSAQPALQAACINKVGRDRSGVATSTYYLGGDIGQGVGPMVGGLILNVIAGSAGYVTVFNACGVLVTLALIYFTVYTYRQHGHAFKAERI